ncbi:MAG: 4-hydroxythreonine-4-phosphate dehydrogenase PdxA [Bacteroidia bacterium]|nr:4-hydroxythreonine-4-phosphate dehydrogenase PdxA [Bacteroidia bacterium]
MSADAPEQPRPRIAISLGDPHGIGTELALKLLEDPRILRLCTPVLVGSGKVLHVYRKLLDLEKVVYQQVDHPNDIRPDRINLVDASAEVGKIEPGVASPEAGKIAFEALELAVKYLKQGAADALLTLPIDKQTIQSTGFAFPGHTEYLAAQFGGGQTLMLMVHPGLRVGVVTGHIPLKQVPSALTQTGIVQKLTVLKECLQLDFGIRKPKLAVLGLNPHAGDGGLLGDEDLSVIAPAVKQTYNKGWLCFGPYSADGFFAMGQYTGFDGILAMYHDQGLIPFKTLSRGEGVNYTAGLPIVRTSPDHGTAYDIAGKGVADVTSTRNALYLAIDTWRTRAENKALLENALGAVELPAHLKAEMDETVPDEPETSSHTAMA